MKLKTFDTIALPSAKRGAALKPLIGLNSQSGTFRINATAVQLMKLKKGQYVKFHNDEDNTDDWYLEVVKDDTGFLLRYKENITPNGLIFQSCALAKLIFSSVAYNKISGHLQIGTEPVKNGGITLWPLITGLLQND